MGHAQGAGAALMPSLVAAAIAGFFGAGIGGRLAMFMLRVTSGPEVMGLQSDDDFEIGQVTLLSIPLILALTAFTTLTVGPMHALARGWVPAPMRPAVFATVLGLVGGGAVVHADGVDFQLLTPRWLAVALFVAVPASVGLLLEPAYALAGWARRTPAVVAVLIGVVMTAALGLVAGGVLFLGAVLLGWIGLVAAPSRVLPVYQSRAVTLLGRSSLVLAAGFGAGELFFDINELF